MALFNICKHTKLPLILRPLSYETVHNRTVSVQAAEDDEFRVLELFPNKKKVIQKKGKRHFLDAQIMPPREKRMPIDQDWPSVWPTAKTFRPSVVPLPVYQGYDQKRTPPGKYANAELMKIPNFLHLTPPAIKRHCASIKKFCSPFPKGLKTDEECEKHFPIEVIESDYCHSSPTVRDERSRIVTLKIKMKYLDLDYHGRDKLQRLLLGHACYDKHSGVITLTADRCPLRKQNYDYLIYLLTALHHESWVTEPWEHEKTEADMEKFFFEGSRIQKKIINTILLIQSSKDSGKALTEQEVKESEEVVRYEKAVTNLLNDKESKTNLQQYKDSILKSLRLEL